MRAAGERAACDGAASGGKCTGLVGLYSGLCAGMRVGMHVGHAPNCAANASGVFERNAFFCAKKICNNKPGGFGRIFCGFLGLEKIFYSLTAVGNRQIWRRLESALSMESATASGEGGEAAALRKRAGARAAPADNSGVDSFGA